MSLKDTKLQKELEKLMLELEHKIDYISPSPLRWSLNEQLVRMRIELREYKQ